MKRVKYCPICHHMAYADMTTCPQCGFKFTDTIESSPSDNLFYKFQGGELHEVKPAFCNMSSAWNQLFARFTDFTGTSSRSEFWFAQLWNALISGVLLLGLFATHMSETFEILYPTDFGISRIPTSSFELSLLFSGVLALWFLFSCVPLVALLARRLRDVGLSNIWIIILIMGVFLPGLGRLDIIALIVLCAMPSMRWTKLTN